ncbi:MAG: hypothetical protein HON23_03600 [Rickettsiales bacterium]|jgi:hypothetical protein|nr:hypothetical protein [Rickettsiales bacterium]
MSQLKRRGFLLGHIPEHQDQANDPKLWSQGYPVLLKGQCRDDLQSHSQNIKQTEELVRAVLEEQNLDDVLAKAPYAQRLEPKFQSLGSVYDERDTREVETVIFDATSGDKIIAEDIWLKASWLSLLDDDASLRFRFSFGIDLEEDVALDPYRQQLSAELTDRIFPESGIITSDIDLWQKLKGVLGSDSVNFVERIIYFNAEGGGAYFHHDLERGHAGVVFAQLTGSTFWFALPTWALIEEVIHFSETHPWPDSLTLEMRDEMDELVKNRPQLSLALHSFVNDSLIHLINETKEFAQFLISRGHSTQLHPGDVLLLPQKDEASCCWHSVFCLGEEMGQALSFAIRAGDVG